MYLLKMGWISDFLSAAVLTGFTFGVAFNVAAGQVFKITGTEKAGDNTWQKLWEWIQSIPDANTATVVVGGIALAITFGLKFVAPRVPAALIAVAFGIAATKLFDLADRGVALIGDVPRGLPSITLPTIQFIFDNWTTIIGTAIGLVLVGFSVSTAAVRNFAASTTTGSVSIRNSLLSACPTSCRASSKASSAMAACRGVPSPTRMEPRPSSTTSSNRHWSS